MKKLPSFALPLANIVIYLKSLPITSKIVHKITPEAGVPEIAAKHSSSEAELRERGRLKNWNRRRRLGVPIRPVLTDEDRKRNKEKANREYRAAKKLEKLGEGKWKQEFKNRNT